MQVDRLARAAPVLAGTVALVALGGCGGDDGSATISGSSASASPTAGAAASRTATGTARPTEAGARPPAAARTGGPTESGVAAPPRGTSRPTRGAPATVRPVPSVAVSTLPPVPLNSAAALQSGITLSIPSVKDTTVGAIGPGEIAGPAV